MLKFSALAVPAPTREPRVMAAPRPAAAMTFFIVRDFFSLLLFAECRSGHSPSTATANVGHRRPHSAVGVPDPLPIPRRQVDR